MADAVHYWFFFLKEVFWMPNMNRELLLEQMYGRIMYSQALDAYTHVYDAASHGTSEADKALKLALAEETLRNLLRMYLEVHDGPDNSIHCE